MLLTNSTTTMRKALSVIAVLVLCVSCTVVSRYIKYGYADIDDYKIFPYTEINTGDNVFHFKQGNEEAIKKCVIQYAQWKKGDSLLMSLDDFLQKTSTVSFLVIRNDSILFEKYYRGYDRSHISTFFSTSKSVTSLLVGLAVDDGLIKSVHDPISKYIPELNGKAPEYQRLTIEDLLNMRSGLKFDESYSNPFSGMARMYYGTNQLGQLKRMKFAHEPGTVHDYQSASTALLGIAVEKAGGKELGKYLEEKIWIPLGMENRATWSLDDKRHRSTKAYCGLNATAIDLAKIGRLYLNGGQWNGKQIINPAWITATTTPDVENDGYQYQWYSEGVSITSKGSRYFPDSLSAQEAMEKAGKRYQRYKVWQDEQNNNQWRVTAYVDYFTLGIMHQVMYVNPDKKIIVVRLGENDDVSRGYPDFIFRLIEQL